ncbi:MAG: MBL fold metallo-hydrolase [Dysgonomonas sp.]
MILQCLGSSSSGNCYIIGNDIEAIILEAGKTITLAKVKQALNFNIRKVKAVLISHLHDDHAGRAKEYECVFPTYSNRSVIEAKRLTHTTEIFAGKSFFVGGFKILPFLADHDVPCFGFIIQHQEIGNMLFLTDSASCDYEFKNLNHIMIECNFSRDILTQSVENGLHPSVAKRVNDTHMELNTCKRALQNQDLSNVYNIVLLHLSNNNSDADQFKEVLSKATGKPIQIAESGFEVEIINKPF